MYLYYTCTVYVCMDGAWGDAIQMALSKSKHDYSVVLGLVYMQTA